VVLCVSCVVCLLLCADSLSFSLILSLSLSPSLPLSISPPPISIPQSTVGRGQASERGGVKPERGHVQCHKHLRSRGNKTERFKIFPKDHPTLLALVPDSTFALAKVINNLLTPL
jgi:hypothetical protein